MIEAVCEMEYFIELVNKMRNEVVEFEIFLENAPPDVLIVDEKMFDEKIFDMFFDKFVGKDRHDYMKTFFNKENIM